MKKPFPVKIVEALGWVYVALAAVLFVGGVAAVLRAASDGPLFVWIGLFPLALAVGMVLSLRRGRRIWFLAPHTVVMLGSLFGAASALCESLSAAVLTQGLVPLLLLCVPVVLLYLPASTRWFKATAEKGRPDALGGWGLFVVILLLLGVVSMSGSLICSRISRTHAQSLRMTMRGRNLFVFMTQNETEHEAGGEWIDPSSFTNSTQFVQALWAQFGKGAAFFPGADSWCIAVNPPDDDSFPVVVTANIDPRDLLYPQDADQPLKLTCPGKWGGVCFAFCEKAGVMIAKGGAATLLRNKYACPRRLFPDGLPQPRPDTYYLTPTGRLDLAVQPPSCD